MKNTSIQVNVEKQMPNVGLCLFSVTYTYTGTHPSVFVFEFIFEIETHIFTSLFGFIL